MCRSLLGCDIGNDRQVGRWMFEALGWWPHEGHARTKDGHWSVAEEDIRPYATLPGSAGKACRQRLRFQALRKYASTYTRALVALAEQSGDGRLHCGFKQDGTDTQRLSSAGPNLQNLPKSERQPLPWLKDLPDIRAAFRCEAGWKVVIRDFSQIELRLVAHYSRDPALLKVYRDGLDLHAMTQEKLGGIERTNAKIYNFSICYDISARSLAVKVAMAKNLWPPDEGAAQAGIDAFFRAYPGVVDMHDELSSSAQANKYAETITGFKRPLTEWGGKGKWGTRRKAINTPVQGSAGGLIKWAMAKMRDDWKAKGWLHTNVRFVAQVHDEAVVEAREDYAERVAEDMDRWMVAAGVRYGLLVPLASAGGIGDTWAAAK